MDNNQAAEVEHRQQASEKLSPIGRKLFKYVEFDSDEQLLAEIRKHPIGYIIIAITGIFISLAIFLGTILLSVNLESLGIDLGGGGGSLKAIIIVFGALLALVALAVTAISIVLYERNVVYVTNEKLAEVAYISLFNRKITQLGLGQIEDVTVSQKGIYARIFNFGTLIIETAGEKENATFTYVPNPNFYSQIIIEAHEQNVQHYGN